VFIASSAEETFKMEKKSEYTKITSTTPIELQASVPGEKKKKKGNQFFSSLLTKCAMIFRTVEDKKRYVLLTKK
jgi:hypothetical protein